MQVYDCWLSSFPECQLDSTLRGFGAELTQKIIVINNANSVLNIKDCVLVWHMISGCH